MCDESFACPNKNITGKISWFKIKNVLQNETKHKERDKIIYMNIPIINHLEESTY